MPNVRKQRGGTVKAKARGNKRNLPYFPQLSNALDVASAGEFSQRGPPENLGCLPSSISRFAVDGISDSGNGTSPRSPNSPRNDVDSLEKGAEPRSSPQSLSEVNSDDEVIIFPGRAGRNLKEHGLQSNGKSPKPKAEKDNKVLARSMLLPTMTGVDGQAESSKESRIWEGRKELRGKRSRRWNGRKRVLEEDEDNPIIADYISNLQSTDGTNDPLITNQFRHRDLALDSCAAPIKGLDADDELYQEIRNQDDWDSAALQDFEEFSSSSEPMNSTPLILRKRFRKSETQYLVVASGEPVDEARWLTRNLLTAPAASDQIEIFEESQSKERYFAADSGSNGQSSTPEPLEDEEDEEDLKERSKNRISDEHIARLLSKQAELGLVGDDLVLFDALSFNEASNDKLSALKYAALSPKSAILSRKSKKESSIHFPTAVSTENRTPDPYDGFDVMDYERPSLRKKTKGGQPSELVLDLSDSDLQQSMVAAWQSDRMKKKQRKQERELLRSQGLLGNNGKRNTRKKPGGDIAMGDVIREIKAFLQSSATSRPLPPMGQRERKLIHIIAHKSGLTSKSLGKGAARFPVLYKTSRTKILTPGLEAEISALLTPKHVLPRSDKFRWKDIPANRSGTAGMATAASYRDGEIVGIGAPEIGTENKGRTMLERMGWSTGNSLGAGNNKGIVQPIEQVVKTSKAGLG